MKQIVVFSGSSHPELSRLIVSRLGMAPGQLVLQRFANDEIGVEIQQSVRDMDVYIIQTAYGHANDHLLELLILVHACKIASAARGISNDKMSHPSRHAFIQYIVTAVVPCFPYSRHIPCPADKPLEGPLTSRQEALLPLFQNSDKEIGGYRFWTARSGTLIANMITAAGADHVITLDLHEPQFEGFFDIPVDNLRSLPLMIKYIKEHIPSYKGAMVVSPDAGGAKRASELANLLGTGFALIHKNRTRCPDDDDRLVLVGDVIDRDVIVLDDMADTCCTLAKASHVLKSNGARRIYAVITHGVFSGDSIALMERSPIDEIIISNTLSQSEHMKSCPKFKVFDISPILAEAIRRTHNGESISCLFNPWAFQ